MEVIIREGQIKDCKETLRLIKELAEFEKALDEVTLTIEELEEDGFGPSPKYRLLVAEYNEEIVGIALFYYKYSTWKGKCVYLDDIIVTEKFRNKGIGSKLFKAVVFESKRYNAKRMEWQVLDWNKQAINFYKKYHAVLNQEWVNGKLTFEQFEQFLPKNKISFSKKVVNIKQGG